MYLSLIVRFGQFQFDNIENINFTQDILLCVQVFVPVRNDNFPLAKSCAPLVRTSGA